MNAVNDPQRHLHPARLLTAILAFTAAALIVIAAGLPDRARLAAVHPISAGELPTAPEIGALAPSIEGLTLRGDRFSLAGLKGQSVIVNFWATWCAPCEIEMPILQQLSESGIAVIGVNFQERPIDVLNWLSARRLTFPVLIDRDGQISRFFQARGLPTTYFVDRAGVIAAIVYGPLSESQLANALSRIR